MQKQSAGAGQHRTAMRMAARTWLGVGLLLICVAAGPAAVSAPAGFSEGVKAYNSRQYGQAVSYLTQAARQAPADPMVRYYLGLAYQGMNQMTLARQQYEWVAGCRTNPGLQSQAMGALQNLSKYQPSRQGSAITVASRGTAPGGRQQVASGTQQVSGRLQILMFETDW